jgi:hypothetical protein
MENLDIKYYIKALKLNFKLSELVIDDGHIKIDNYKYVKLSKRPAGRHIDRVLHSLQNVEDKIVLLK